MAKNTLSAYTRFIKLLWAEYAIPPGTIRSVKLVDHGIELQLYKDLPGKIPQYIDVRDNSELLELATILQGDVMHREYLARNIWAFGSARGGFTNFKELREKLLSKNTRELETMYSKLERQYSGNKSDMTRNLIDQLFTHVQEVPTDYFQQEVERAEKLGLGDEGIIDIAIRISDERFSRNLSSNMEEIPEKREQSEYDVLPEQ